MRKPARKPLRVKIERGRSRSIEEKGKNPVSLILRRAQKPIFFENLQPQAKAALRLSVLTGWWAMEKYTPLFPRSAIAHLNSVIIFNSYFQIGLHTLFEL